MTPKEYLRRIRKQELDLRRLEKEMAVMESRCQKITSGWSDMQVQSSHSDYDKTDKIIKYIDKKTEFEKAWDKLIDDRDMAIKAINAMEDRVNATILWWYYIKGVKWERVAVEVNMDIRWVHRRHDKALREFSSELATKSH